MHNQSYAHINTIFSNNCCFKCANGCKITQNLCFAHKSLVQAWRFITFGRNILYGLQVYKVKIATKTDLFSSYVFDRFTNFLCIFCFINCACLCLFYSA